MKDDKTIAGLTIDDQRLIAQLYAEYLQLKQQADEYKEVSIAKRLGVSHRKVSAAIHNRSYKHEMWRQEAIKMNNIRREMLKKLKPLTKGALAKKFEVSQTSIDRCIERFDGEI